MGLRYIGGVLSATAQTSSPSSAKGIWNITDAAQAKQANNWVSAATPTVEYLVIAGGGGGGAGAAGGGAAGGCSGECGFGVSAAIAVTAAIAGGGASGMNNAKR